MAVGLALAGGKKLASKFAKKAKVAKDTPKTAAARKLREENYDRMIAHEASRAASEKAPRAIAKEANAKKMRARGPSKALPAVGAAAAAAGATKAAKESRSRGQMNRNNNKKDK